MITNFCEQLAIDLKEIQVPVFIENLAYWIRKNAANNKHLHNGRYWSYNSYPAFAKLYPFWSEQTIRRIIKKAVKLGLLIIGNFNKRNYDNTNWYTLTDKAMQYYPALHNLIIKAPVENDSTHVENDRPIPTLLPSSSNNTITTSEFDNSPTTEVNKKQKPQKTVNMAEVTDAYHEVLPDSPKIRVIDTKLANQINKMIKNWPKYSSSGQEFTLQGFKDFLLAIKQHQPRFLLPYNTEKGKGHNNLRTITHETNLAKLINNEFNFK